MKFLHTTLSTPHLHLLHQTITASQNAGHKEEAASKFRSSPCAYVIVNPSAPERSTGSFPRGKSFPGRGSAAARC